MWQESSLSVKNQDHVSIAESNRQKMLVFLSICISVGFPEKKKKKSYIDKNDDK
jgi:hypothetical protein